ncbi:MAG: hypothetical protein KDA31_14200 [Phycisphaerales bacterium]|nr:hypothetical protein [Phycisphaerales bacterium]
MMLIAPARAQILNLDGPAAPAPGTSVLAAELIERFTRSADRLDPDAWQNDPDRRALESAKRELRLAGATLAERGNGAGTDGSHLVLAAMTIDRRLEEIDELLTGSNDRALLLALAHDLEELRLNWSRGGEITPAQLDRDLRYAFAQLALLGDRPRPDSAGWILPESLETPSDLDAILARLGEAGVDGETLALLEDDLDRLELMREWPGFVREAQVRSRLIAEAADVLSHIPVWMSEGARNRLVQDFAGAVRSENPEARDAALELIAAQGRVIALLTEMGEGRQGDRLRSRFTAAIADRSTSDTDSLMATQLAVRTLDVSESLSNLQRDDAMLRQLRPTWRRLVPLVRDAMVNARDAAINLIVDPAGVTNPGVLSAIAAQQRLREDFAVIERFSVRFAPGDSPMDKANTAIADRLLAIGQDMNDNDALLEPSLRLMRDLDAELDLWEEIENLREPVSRVIGQRRDDLALRLSNLQNQWLAGWGTPGGLGAGEGVAEDLKVVRDVMLAMADVSAFTDLAALESWPGYEMDQQVRRLITRELTAQIDALAGETIRGPSEISRQRTAAGLVSLRGTFGAALLTGRLARLGESEGLAPTNPIGELGLGPPARDSWMAPHRDALADISWYAAELSRVLVGDPDESEQRTQEVHAHLRWRALRTLEAIERESSN